MGAGAREEISLVFMGVAAGGCKSWSKGLGSFVQGLNTLDSCCNAINLHFAAEAHQVIFVSFESMLLVL